MSNLYQILFYYSSHPVICHKVFNNDSGQILKFEKVLANQVFLDLFDGELDLLTENESGPDGFDFFSFLCKVQESQIPEVAEHFFSDKKRTLRFEGKMVEDSVLATSVEIVNEVKQVKSTVGNPNSATVLMDSTFQSSLELRKLLRAVEQSPVSIVITDTDGTIEYVNPVFMEMTGYTPEEVLGKNPRILKSGMVCQKDYEEMWETIKSGSIWKGEFINKKKNGDLYFEQATIAPVLNSEGVTTHFVAIKEDITETKKYEQDLIDTREKARESEILKAAFLQNMSHEIRTPMNAILGFSELAKMTETSVEKRNSYLDIVIESTHRLLGIVDDIMDISKLETGTIVLKNSPIRLQGFLLNLYNSFIDNTGSQVLLEKPVIDPELQNINIYIDSSRLRQVLEKLLSNAVKFTKQGSVKFGCTRIGGALRFYVEDTGIGIQSEMFSLIFQPFYQLDMGATRAFGGNGLGLTIASRIVDKMGSSIKVDSHPGKGSTFYFDVWPEYSDGISTPDNSMARSVVPEKNHFSLLVASDKEMDFIMIREILNREFGRKIKVIKASSANQAIEICREQGPVDLILMDVKLRDMEDGRAARQLKSMNPNAAVIAQTGKEIPTDKANLLEAGCDDIIIKPVYRDDLIDLMYKHLKITI
ncbi:ATP-binding protein [Marinilabilia sp.]|uniref:hybrid sensor histidine kinase/response regulator n=1 Tax=Marinilabilia sp. TaxID=2021252 RepID=UPI0025BB2A24|nr:ATP-binding protein [Marinilabilia sp.]